MSRAPRTGLRGRSSATICQSGPHVLPFPCLLSETETPSASTLTRASVHAVRPCRVGRGSATGGSWGGAGGGGGRGMLTVVAQQSSGEAAGHAGAGHGAAHGQAAAQRGRPLRLGLRRRARAARARRARQALAGPVAGSHGVAIRGLGLVLLRLCNKRTQWVLLVHPPRRSGAGLGPE